MGKLKELMEDDMAPGIGHNQPPEPTPFDLSEQEIENLYEEALHWLDGEKVTTEEHCKAVQKIMSDMRAAAKLADDRRTAENIPFDEGKKAVQAKYAPLIADTKSVKGKAVLAIDACKKAMQPFMEAKEREAQEAARKARAEADRRAAEALEAMRASQVDDLAARENAERLLSDAKFLERQAVKAEKAPASVKGGTGRASSLRTVYEHEITDMREFARWCWVNQKPEMDEFFNGLAKTMVGYGKRDIPGVTVHERKVVV